MVRVDVLRVLKYPPLKELNTRTNETFLSVQLHLALYVNIYKTIERIFQSSGQIRMELTTELKYQNYDCSNVITLGNLGNYIFSV